MSDLKERRCAPCAGGVRPYTSAEAEALLPQLHPDWQVVEDGRALLRQLKFKDFYRTMSFVNALAHVAVVISDGGRKAGAYGLYHGDGMHRDDHPDRIIIYRDTLRRDFGHDPELLREQVVRTVRHELAHHVGFDEMGVQGLGL